MHYLQMTRVLGFPTRNDDPVYVGLTYSNDDIDEFMKHAGIENGFFTVRMGNQEATQYYTKSENHTLDIP